MAWEESGIKPPPLRLTDNPLYPLPPVRMLYSTSSCGSHHFTHPVKDGFHNLLADGVVPAGIVVSCVLLATDQLLRVIQLTIGAISYFI